MIVLVIIVSILNIVLSLRCPDVPDHNWRDIGPFHWEVLGVEDDNGTVQRERLVDVLLEGFNCQNRLQNLVCRDGRRVNTTLQEFKSVILDVHVNESVNKVAAQTLALGRDLEYIACRHTPVLRNSHVCHQIQPSSFLYSAHRLVSEWRPQRMRHLVWQGCPRDVAFVRKRRCYQLVNRYPSRPNPMTNCNHVNIISHLIQGHRLMNDPEQSCEFDYVRDVFKVFANTTGDMENWRMYKTGLESLLQNLSHPYPPLPRSNRSGHSHSHKHQQVPMDMVRYYHDYGLIGFQSGHIGHGLHNIGHNRVPSTSESKTTGTNIPGNEYSSAPVSSSSEAETTERHVVTSSTVSSSESLPSQASPLSDRQTSTNGRKKSPTELVQSGEDDTTHFKTHIRKRRDSPDVHGLPYHLDGNEPQDQPDKFGPPDHSDNFEPPDVPNMFGAPGYFDEGPNFRDHYEDPIPPGPFPLGPFPPGADHPADTRRFHSSHNHEAVSNVWDASQLLTLMTGDPDHSLSISDFYELCPVLVHQLLFVFNLPTQPTHNATEETPSTATRAEVYGYSSLAVFIITLCSLVGVIFVKVAKGKTRNYVMAAMLALAAGNLCGDATLHLVPEVIGPEGTDVDGDGHFTNEVLLPGNSDIELSSVKMMLMLASIYVFFVLEMITSIYHSHDHDVQMVMIQESNIPKKKTLTRVTGGSINHLTDSPSVSGMEVAIPSSDPLPSVPEEEEDEEDTSDVKQSEIQVTVTKTVKDKDLQAPMTLAWMVIVGDAIHNFADGLEIGATFSKSLADGLSTSLAVFCHELPHELGDFAVLVSTGMSIQKALVLNFVSGLTAFIGLYLGILTGSQDNVRVLIFAVGAGMFLYVALANLVPELMKYFQRHRDWKMFLCQNIGWLLGYSVMVVIAIYEDELTFGRHKDLLHLVL